MLKLLELTTEYRSNPIGIDTPAPRFSWKLHSEQQNLRQASYQIRVVGPDSAVWDSGSVNSEQSVAIVYQGAPLVPNTRYHVTVTVTDNFGQTAAVEGSFQTGLLAPENWSARWITHAFEDELIPAAVFTKRLHNDKPIQAATIFVSALGIYELDINGQKVGDAFFAPGWTSYQKRLQYQAYDVTSLLHGGDTLQITVGNGWYKGVLGFHGQGCHYGSRTAVIAQMELDYADGSHETVCTDESWESSWGEVQYNDFYNGEVIDKTAQGPVAPVKLLEHGTDILVAQQDEPVRVTQRVAAKQVLTTPKGETVLDFGQNLAGVVEAKLCCPRGTKVVLSHAETLDEDGNFYTANLRTAKAEDTFICSGEDDIFLPRFTYHGFRYIRIEGLAGKPNPKDFTACVLHTDMPRTGQFHCDNPLVDRLWQNIDWTMRSNYLEIPSDCPQRDERFGYTGDAQIFLPTAACHRNVALFFEKWLQDLKVEQQLGQGVPTAVPNILGAATGGIAIWHDAATIVPWTLWQTYGDRRFLEEQFDSMVSCVEFTRSRTGADGLIHTGQQLGDWVAMDAERGPLCKYRADRLELSPVEKTGATDVYFVANLYYLHSVQLVAQAAQVLGRAKEESVYQALYQDLLDAMRKEYVTATGRLVSETQTGCVLALQFGLVEEQYRPRVVQALLDNLQRHDNHLTTGFAGTQFLCSVLSQNGAHEVAGKVFLKEDCPSWLYSVKLGATTVWELWDGVNEDGSFNKYEMNSLNQYAFASVGSWIFHDLCGLRPLEPGYKVAEIAPRLILGIPALEASLETVYGTLGCSISCRDGKYTIDISIPANTTAWVTLPEQEKAELGSGQYHFEYQTESCFEKQPYNMETTFGELLENPIASALLEQYASELLQNQLFMQFAAAQPLETVCAMLPPEMKPLIDMILGQCNAEAKKDK